MSSKKSMNSLSISPEQKPLDHNRKNTTQKLHKKQKSSEKSKKKKHKTKTKSKRKKSILYSLNSNKDFDNIIKRMNKLNSKK